MRRLATIGFVSFCWLFVATTQAVSGPGGTLKIEVIDRQTGQPVACRMSLTNAAGKSLKAPRVPYWHDHFVFNGNIAIKLPQGEYDFTIDRGPEYLTRTGHFTMDNFSNDKKVIDLQRFADMAAEGWWSGDVDVARFTKDLALLMRAEDLHVAELITWPDREVLLGKNPNHQSPVVAFDTNRFVHISAGIDARGGGTLLLFNLEQPIDLGGLSADYPPQVDLLREAKSQSNAWIDAREAYGWDVPVWVASGELDSVQVLNSHLRRTKVVEHEHEGRPRDKLVYQGVSGNGRWSEAIYYHLLNCGLRIPPTAGSGSGEAPNAVGYNRMYVHVEGDLTYDRWWEGVRAGRVVITNGPLIRPNVEGELPGFVFQADTGQQVELEVGLNLSTQDDIEFVEVIKNGLSEYQIPMKEFAQTGRLPPVAFAQSGWMIIRAVVNSPNTYRYAMTAPYYVEIGGQRRVSKASAQFFLDWIKERSATLKLEDAAQRALVLKTHDAARDYWQTLLDQANAP